MEEKTYKPDHGFPSAHALMYVHMLTTSGCDWIGLILQLIVEK